MIAIFSLFEIEIDFKSIKYKPYFLGSIINFKFKNFYLVA